MINYLTKLQNKRGNYPKQVLLQDNIKDKLVTAGIIHRKLYQHVLTVCAYIVKQPLNQNSGQSLKPQQFRLYLSIHRIFWQGKTESFSKNCRIFGQFQNKQVSCGAFFRTHLTHFMSAFGHSCRDSSL